MRVAVDAHADTVQRLVDLGERFDDKDSAAEVSLAKARRGGLAAQFFALWVDPVAFAGAAAWPRTLRLLGALQDSTGRGRRARVRLARSGRDVRACVAQGAFAVLVSVEGAHALGGATEPLATRLARLAELAQAGVRLLSPTWAASNDLAGSSGDAGRSRGLSAGGQELVCACVAHGVLLDASHASDPTFDDLAAWALSTGRPLCASHSSARAVTAHPRNLTDAQLRTIADTGGVASANFCPAFLDASFRTRVTAATRTPAARQAEAAARRGVADPGRAALAAWQVRVGFARALPAPGLERVVAHLVHMLRVAGEDHVGLGSDFDGIATVPVGLEDVSCLPRLGRALARAGVRARVLDKVFADNWLRVLDA